MSKFPFEIPLGVEAEYSLFETESRTVSVGEGQVRHQQTALNKGHAIRVIHDHKQGLVTSTNADPANQQQMFDKALELSKNSPSDPHQLLAQPSSSVNPSIPTDKNIFKRPLPEVVGGLKAIEEKILAFDPRIKKVVRLELREHLQRQTLINSHGLSAETQSSSTSFLGEVTAQDGQEIEVAWDFRQARFSNEIDFDKIADELSRLSVQSLGGKPIATGKYPVLVHPRVGCQLLNLLSEAMSADSVQMGRSFLKDLLNGEIGSTLVTLEDDPHLKNGVSSTHVDDEGMPTQKTVLVDKGVLKDFFFDLRTASRAERKTNGHGFKSGLGAKPRPSPTNFFMKAGTSSQSEFYSSGQNVFYLWDVMGLHMVDLVTGEFSLGASGLLYSNGKFNHAVRGVTISGRLLDLLKNVSMIGSKIEWYGDRGTPHFLVSQLTVAGI